MPPKDTDTAKPAAKPKSRKAPAGDGTEKVPKKARPNKVKKKQKVRSEEIEGQSSTSTESGFELRSALVPWYLLWTGYWTAVGEIVPDTSALGQIRAN